MVTLPIRLLAVLICADGITRLVFREAVRRAAEQELARLKK